MGVLVFLWWKLDVDYWIGACLGCFICCAKSSCCTVHLCCVDSKYAEVDTKTKSTLQWKWWRRDRCRKLTLSTKPKQWCIYRAFCFFLQYSSIPSNTVHRLWKCVICTSTTTQQQPFYDPLSGTTRVSRYQKKHSPTYHPDHHPVFISFFHPPRSIASSLFKLRAWHSFCTSQLLKFYKNNVWCFWSHW